nr:hypothetical protein [Tanacetum cinerariifolium]
MKTRKKDNELPQTSVPTEVVADEAVCEEMYDSVEWVATIDTGLDVEHDRGSGPRRQETMGDAAAQTRVIALETTKTNQALEIGSLKRRVKKLEKKASKRTYKRNRLYKIGSSRRTESSDEASLGDQEDASKQRRIIDNLDVDEGVTLVDETHRRNDQECLTQCCFTTHIISMDDITLAKALAALKSAKPIIKETSVHVSVVSSTSTSVTTTTKAKGIVMQEPKEITIRTRTAVPSQSSKDKGKDDVQAMMDADHEIAKRLQTEEQGELSNEERSKLFMKLMNQRKKHFVRLRAEEKMRKPPTKAQKRNQMCTYLKNMASFTHHQLKNKNFEEVQKAFDNTISWINSFVPIDKEVAEGSETRAEGSSKSAREELKSDKSKKQKLDEKIEAKEDNDQEKAEMKMYMKIVSDDEIAIDAIPLATKPPIINIDREDLETLWKLVKAKYGNTRPEEAYERVLWGDLKVMLEPDIESK